MGSYNFQRTSDNMSFVSDCLSPNSSEASYGSSSSKTSLNNNNRRYKLNNTHSNNQNIVAISFEKQDPNSHKQNRQDELDPTHSSSTTQNVHTHLPPDIQASPLHEVTTPGRISPAALYVDTSQHHTELKIIPSMNVSMMSLRNQAILGAPPTVAIIRSEDLYPHQPQPISSHGVQHSSLRIHDINESPSKLAKRTQKVTFSDKDQDRNSCKIDSNSNCSVIQNHNHLRGGGRLNSEHAHLENATNEFGVTSNQIGVVFGVDDDASKSIYRVDTPRGPCRIAGLGLGLGFLLDQRGGVRERGDTPPSDSDA